jgi:hypothetical protein
VTGGRRFALQSLHLVGRRRFAQKAAAARGRGCHVPCTLTAASIARFHLGAHTARAQEFAIAGGTKREISRIRLGSFAPLPVQRLSIVGALVCGAQYLDTTGLRDGCGRGNVGTAFAKRQSKHRIEQRRTR